MFLSSSLCPLKLINITTSFEDICPISPWLEFEASKKKDGIPIEEREPDEVRGVKGSFGKVIWGPSEAKTYNPAFDVTPENLVTGYVLDKGLFKANELWKAFKN